MSAANEPTIHPGLSSETLTPLPAFDMDSSTPEKFVRAMWAEARAQAREELAEAGSPEPGGKPANARDPWARKGVMALALLGALAWGRHEVNSDGFKDAMEAQSAAIDAQRVSIEQYEKATKEAIDKINEATFIMVGVICNAHPQAGADCRSAEWKLKPQ